MPASQAGRRRFDPGRPLQFFLKNPLKKEQSYLDQSLISFQQRLVNLPEATRGDNANSAENREGEMTLIARN